MPLVEADRHVASRARNSRVDGPARDISARPVRSRSRCLAHPWVFAGACASSASSSFAANRTDERAKPVDLDLDGIAVTQKASLGSAHACGRAGRDYVAGQQGDRAREPRDEVGWSEDQVGGRALLQYLAVDSCAQPKRSQVADLIE